MKEIPDRKKKKKERKLQEKKWTRERLEMVLPWREMVDNVVLVVQPMGQGPKSLYSFACQSRNHQLHLAFKPSDDINYHWLPLRKFLLISCMFAMKWQIWPHVLGVLYSTLVCCMGILVCGLWVSLWSHFLVRVRGDGVFGKVWKFLMSILKVS